jgi:hypothetical protein
METLVEAMDRLRGAGYELDLFALDGGRLRCGACAEVVDARDATVDEVVRFEGMSNPDDMAILTALSCPNGHRGLFSAAYGPTASAQEAEVLLGLTRR